MYSIIKNLLRFSRCPETAMVYPPITWSLHSNGSYTLKYVCVYTLCETETDSFNVEHNFHITLNIRQYRTNFFIKMKTEHELVA
jgi:hypothetical protein